MKRQRPDTRLDWRDPNMPVLREYRMGDGSVKHLVDPNYEQRYRDMLVHSASTPSWRDDPTYNLKRQKRAL